MGEYDDRWLAAQARAASADLGLDEQRRILHGPDPRLRRLLAANPAAHPLVQRELADLRWCWAPLGSNPGLTSQVQLVLAKSQWCDMQLALLQHPAMDASAQEVLAQSLYEDVRRGLASYPQLAPSAAARLADDPRSVRRLAANPALPWPLLRRLLTHGDVPVRASAAGNAALPSVEQLGLISAEPTLVRRGLAGNPRLDPQAAGRLLCDEVEVRCALAANPSLPPALLRSMARGEGQVRRVLAGNPAIGGALAEEMADQRPVPVWLKRALAGNEALPEHVQLRYADVEAEEVAVRLAGNPAVAAAVQGVLAGRIESEVRQALAGNPGLNVDVAVTLAGDAEPHVRRRLAGNPALPLSVQERLAADREAWVLEVLVRRPDFVRPALRVLLLGLFAFPEDSSPRRAVLRQVPVWDGPAKTDTAILDLAMAGPVAVAVSHDRGLLDAAWGHPDPLVRIAALSTPGIDADLAEELLNDPDPAVVYAASKAILALMA